MPGPRRDRRPLFALVAAVVVLLGMEGAAWVAERMWPVPARTLPTAQPGGDHRELKDQIRAVRRQTGANALLSEDQLRGWGLPPNAQLTFGGTGLSTNSLGLRGPELAAKAPDEVRLFTLGDSSVFGYGVADEEVFSSVAAIALQARWGVPVTAVIGGRPGYDSSQALALLEELGPRIAPDIVVVGTLWSDVYIDDPELSRLAETAPVRGVLRGSAAYRLMRRGLAPWLAARQVRWIDSRDDVGDLDAASGRRTRVPLEQYVANLRRMVVVAEGLGATAAFVALPAPMDLDVVPVPQTILEYRAALEMVAAEAGAPWVDGPAWMRAHGGNIGWFLDQVHPNGRGHLALGAALSESLAAHPR